MYGKVGKVMAKVRMNSMRCWSEAWLGRVR